MVNKPLQNFKIIFLNNRLKISILISMFTSSHSNEMSK